MSAVGSFAAQAGEPRADREAVRACEEVAISFCELLDAGDASAAFEMHDEELAFYPPGAEKPLDKAAATAAGERMLTSYPGRRTLHLLGNFLAHATDEQTVVARYVVSVYELTEVVNGQTRERDVPALFAFAHEQATFRRGGDGRWRYLAQRMIPIAPLAPFDGAPA